MDTQNNCLKKCNTCGEFCSDGSEFCGYCGSLLVPIRNEFISEEDSNVKTESYSCEKEFKQTNITDFVQPPKSIPQASTKKNSISNGVKVLLTVICSVVPGFGQLACLILAIIFMNSEGDEDKRSFGLALLIASLAMFVISGVVYFIIAMAVYNPLAN